MIGEELRRIACAFGFLTRLPVPAAPDWPDDRLARSAKYFPLVGLGVGTLCAGAFLAARLAWPNGMAPPLLALGAGLLITGALHEDGLADTADGLGGGRTLEQRLAIMKDSRIGAYGVLALGMILALKTAALGAIAAPLPAAVVLVAAHGLGRSAAVVAMASTPYAGDPQASRLKAVSRTVRPSEAVVGLVLGAAPLFLLPPSVAAAALVAGALAAVWLALTARRLIGGHTGDVLGAVEQTFETGFLLAASAAYGLAS